ncbi:MAG: 4-hydroxy-tetrahydrodipicolinate reductase [Acidimicrobiia bacterium]|nr:MAG: 4-hydroxy-tetrahydrodipicolinate reductase [Acidimicrobiia bacterium]
MIVGVSGATGRLGRVAASAVAEAADVELGPLYAPGHGGEEIVGRPVSDDPEVMSEAEVVVEACPPDPVMENLARWRAMGLHVVVGTSGFDQRRLDELRAVWGDGGPNCLVVPNFSLGAVLMMRLAELAAPHFRAAEVVELHHDRKADAPSGTALETARRLGSAMPGQVRSRESSETVPGSRGGDLSGVRIHSVRLPGLYAHQEVILGNPGEVLTIRHDTSSPEAFAPGILLAVRRVGTLGGGVSVGLDRLLGLSV